MTIQRRGVPQMPGDVPAAAGRDDLNAQAAERQASLERLGPAPGGAPQYAQSQMFMTPSEIWDQYQGLDADREDWEGSTYASSGTGIGTARTEPATGETEGNVRHGEYRWGSDSRGPYQASTYGTKYRSGMEDTEPMEHMWERKLNEAQYEHYVGKMGAEAGQGTEPLHESIGKHGVTHPIRLGSRWEGSEGKPEIVGGHHRLISALEHEQSGSWSHQFLPVLHDLDIWDARSKENEAAFGKYR